MVARRIEAGETRDPRDRRLSPRRSTRLFSIVLVGALIAVGAVACTPPLTPGIAYPDLVSIIPPNAFGITHPTPTTRDFDYTHMIANVGEGDMEVQPTNYNPTTGSADGIQNLFKYDVNNQRVLAQQVPVRDKFYFHVAHGHFHFPLASFGLYAVKTDGSVGTPVAVSPKNGFCIADSNQVDSTLTHSPPWVQYAGDTCANPNAVRGISPGWSDLYDRLDPGQSIDITGVPDGVYWFHTVADPGGNLTESNESNNVTDIKVRIVGDTVIQVNPLVSQGAFVIDQSAIVNGAGTTASTPAFTTSNAGDLLVAYVAAGGPTNQAQAATVSGGGLMWSLVTRANTRRGTSEVWTARAPAMLTNQVISSVLTRTGSWDNSLTVYAFRGAGGIGATATGNAGSGGQSVALATTKAGSWVMSVGNDGDRPIQRVPASGQTMVQQWWSTSTEWVQASPAPTTSAGTTVTMSDSYPRGDSWNYAAVEMIPGASTDTTAPVISTPATSGVGPDYATVDWTTDEPSTTQVNYGTTTAYGQSTPVAPSLVTSHSQLLTGLAANTKYFCQLRSVDPSGNTATATHSFTTAPPRTTPPVFSGITIPDLQPDQAIFAWTTDEPADSQVQYGTTAVYGSVSTRITDRSTVHFRLVTGLASETTYHFRVLGTDAYANSGASGDQVFTTPAIPPPLAVDRSVAVDGRGTVTTAAFDTALPGETLVAFVGANGPMGSQTATVSGASLIWSLVRRANGRPGTAEVWQATAPAPLSGATITSTLADGTASDQSLTVVAFVGSAGIGAISANSAATGPTNVTVTTIRAGSLIYGVGNDWDGAGARTLGSGQWMVHQWVDTGSGDTMWTQARTAAVPAVQSSVTLDTTAPTNHQWNFVGLEIIRPLSVPPPAAAPAIKRVTAAPFGLTAALVSWITDSGADTQIQYGPTSAYGSTTALVPAKTFAHYQGLTGLTGGTTYHFRVLSRNGVGLSTSGDFTVTTP